MSLLTGNNGAIYINNGTHDVNLAQIKSFSVDIKASTIETSVMGQDSKTYLKGLGEWSGSADIIVDTDNLYGGANPIAVLNGTAGLVGDNPVGVKLYIDYESGTPVDDVWQGYVIITDFALKAPHDNMIEATVSFTGSSTVAFTQGSNVVPA
jgi:predicted secreted protein